MNIIIILWLCALVLVGLFCYSLGYTKAESVIYKTYNKLGGFEKNQSRLVVNRGLSELEVTHGQLKAFFGEYFIDTDGNIRLVDLPHPKELTIINHAASQTATMVFNVLEFTERQKQRI